VLVVSPHAFACPCLPFLQRIKLWGLWQLLQSDLVLPPLLELLPPLLELLPLLLLLSNEIHRKGVYYGDCRPSWDVHVRSFSNTHW
jgi:hypothetical protein